jgi:hypothetical protein
VESKKKALEYQEGGKHYVQHAIQPIDSNIVKYATRKKPGETNKQRYNKIIHYAKLGIELDDKSN